MKKLYMLLCIPLILTAADLPNFDPHKHQTRFLRDLYYTLKPKINYVRDLIRKAPHEILQEFVPEDPHFNDDALVRFADYDELCKDEKQFTRQRLDHVQQELAKLLGAHISYDRVPRIGICCSGGGYRSMLLTFGFLKGLQDIGLLDCTTYMAGLSGSTWAMAPWIASKQPLDSFIATLPPKLKDGLETVKQPALLKSLADQLVVKAAYGQFISMIDVSGPTLANTLLSGFDNTRLDVTMSQSHAHIKDGKAPLPIYTAVTANIEPYEWLEFTPFEVGSSFLKAYVPTWAYGRKFKYGRSVNAAPEQSLGYLMGIFGSAFSIDIEDAVRHTSDKIEAFTNNFSPIMQGVIYDIIEGLVNSPLDDVRLAPSTLPNFTYKTKTRPLNHDKVLTLIDAGIHFNLPFAPLLRDERAVDIILVYDASGSISGCKDLKWAESYIREKGLKFPPIDYAVADKQVMSIFKDEHDPTCPIVVYFPRIKNESYSSIFDPEHCQEHGYCKTLNFTYSKEQIMQLMGLSHFTVLQHAQDVKQVIKQVATRA